jgi:FG-GAP-like repeat
MKKRLTVRACLTTFGLTLFVALPAYAGGILYSISSEDNLLRVVDASTGGTLSSVPITLAGKSVSRGNGLATQPVTGRLFALLTLVGQSGRQLVTINPGTGVATSVGNTGDQFAGLAFNSTGILFAVVGDKKNPPVGGLPPETLFRLNTSNAAPTQVLVLARGNDGEAIGFNPNDGLIYHASGNDTDGDGCVPFDSSICVEIFESVNSNTLAVTNVPLSGNYTPLTDNYSEVAALTHLTGNVLLLTDIDQNLYQITTTGVVTFVGSMDHVAKGLAFVNVIVPKLAGHFDTDADRKDDLGIYRDGSWYILRSSDGGMTTVGWGGLAQDIPVPADYDGDGKVDVAIYRDGSWFIRRSSDGGMTTVGWGGLAQDIPVPGDYDGDGKADITVYRDGHWFIKRSSDGGVTSIGWGGLVQDMVVPGDYDGDGKADIAVYRNGVWFILRSSDGGQTTVGWGGLAQDIPVPADYDGDGKTDIAIYRNGLWFIVRSSNGVQTVVGWGGLPQDVPLN